MRCSGLGDADRPQQGHGGLARLGPAHVEVVAQRLGDLVAHPHRRVEGGHRVLEDHGGLARPTRRAWPWCRGRRARGPAARTLPVVVADREVTRPSTDRASTVLPEPDSPTMPRVWPASTCSDTPSTATTVPRGRVEGRAQVGDLEQPRRVGRSGEVRRGRGGRHGGHRSESLTSKLRRSVSPTKFSDRTVKNIAADGTSAVWACFAEVRLAGGDHPAPGGVGRLDAQAQQGERALQHDDQAHGHEGERGHRRHHVGDDLAEQDAGTAGAEGVGGVRRTRAAPRPGCWPGPPACRWGWTGSRSPARSP